jgi:hypothetical protein
MYPSHEPPGKRRKGAEFPPMRPACMDDGTIRRAIGRRRRRHRNTPPARDIARTQVRVNQ